MAGNCREAIDEFKATLALEPNYPVAHLHMSTCLQKLGRNVEAAREKAVYDSVSGTPAGTRQ